MAAWRRVYERYLVVEDIYPAIADRFVSAGATRLVELGGGRGPVAALAAAQGVATVVVDLDEQMLAEAHPPSVRGDLEALPLATCSVDGATAINCLYFLAEPRHAIR